MPVRMVKADTTGRIWVAAFHEIGYLAPDSLGFLQLRSLLEYVPTQIQESTKSWSVALTSRAVYFQSGNVLLRWGEKLRTMKTWRSAAGFSDVHEYDDELYLRKSGVGLMRMDGDSLRLLPGGEKFANIVVYALLPYADARQRPVISPEVYADRLPESAHGKTRKPED